MRFSFKCHVAHHPSGRVTVTPLDLPPLAVHAASVERAVEELALAVEDKIARVHPRLIFDLVKPAGGEPLELEVPGLLVRAAEPDHDETRSLEVTALRIPAHRPFIEVRAPRLDGRVWL